MKASPRPGPGLARTLVAASAAIALLAGCPGPPPPPNLGPTLAPQQALERVIARRGAVRSFRGKVALELTVGGETLDSDAALVVKRPASLRLDTMSLIGPTFLVAIEGPRLAAYAPGERRFYLGTLDANDAPAMLLVPPVPSETLIDLLLATPLAASEGVTIEAGPDGDSFVLTAPAVPDGLRRLTVDARDAAPLTLEEVDAAGVPRHRATWDGAARSVPRGVTIEVPGRSFRLKLEIPEMQLDPELPPTLFQLVPPPGSTVVDLNDGGPAPVR